MFKFRFTLIVILGSFVAVAFTQESVPAKVEDTSAGEGTPVVMAAAEVNITPAPKPAVRKRHPIPVATPTAATTPKPPGFWKRVFGPKTTKATPAPSTPTPVAKTKSGGAPRSAKKQVAATGVTEKTTESSEVSEKPKPVVSKSAAKSKPTGENPQATPPPAEGQDPETQLREKYDAAKVKAAEDPEVKKMKEKADAAPTEEDARKALRDYNKALFKRMREIDPSIKERVDRMETAVLNRLGL
jgi:hypothetical protein